LPLLAIRSRLARPLPPERDVLAEAGAKLVGTGSMTVDLDEAVDGRDPSKEAEALELGSARWIGLVTKVGVLGLRGDLVVNGGDAGAAECLPADLFGEVVESIAHGRSPAHQQTGQLRAKRSRHLGAACPAGVPDMSG
jgi:hypothetical protein